ncbi:MAG: SWIM zinc finger domain-containing protein [Planctomycetales bacterium]|nr:SWIM zinc finger domain-containing protein [Planctomycetales bacterium]
MLTSPHHVRYAAESRCDATGLKLAVALGDSGLSTQFFSGRLARPRRTALMLRGLMSIVQTRFHIPAAMLARILAAADPVVTVSSDRLRFEGFSGCCGVYVRVDLLPDSVRDAKFGRGTTNVDFNAPMLAALAKVRETDKISLNVDAGAVELKTESGAVVEKKVDLPVRWLRGLTEVQACQSRMNPVHEISGQEAWRFLRSMPRMKMNRRETFVVPSGRTLRLSQINAKESVRVGGLERLRVLEDLSSDAETLLIYTDTQTGASGWVLEFDDSRFSVVISPEVWRGFSGEGQVLQSLAAERSEDVLGHMRKELKWQSVIDEEDLHRQISKKVSDVTADQIRGALAILATQGLVGFDLHEGAWFHRELPFDFSSVEKHHPRLKDARKLLVEKCVRILSTSPSRSEVSVTSGGVDHRIRIAGEDAKCTCPWYAKHQLSRGPCKHILAAQLLLEEQADEC